MPRTELEYPKQPYGTVNRYNARASYSLRTIHNIVNTCPILHVSFTPPDSPFPATLPLIGQMGSFERPSADEGDVLTLYLHSYVSSRIVKLAAAAAGASSQTGTQPAQGTPSTQTSTPGPGLPISVAASHVDGIILALTPNNHSYNYRSAILYGHATVVEDPEEKLYAMELITNGVVPSRWEHTRVPPNKAEMSSTTVLRVAIATGSAKLRSGPPSDDKADMGNAEVVARTWTGVVPVYTALGEPIASDYNEVRETPAHVVDFVRDGNAARREFAVEAVKPPVK